MGYLDREIVERAGTHLLEMLQEHSVIRYSEHFYDGTDETHQRLKEALRLEDDWYSPELLMDTAAEQLAAIDVVALTWLDETMADGLPDYQIQLTEKGASKKQPLKTPTMT